MSGGAAIRRTCAAGLGLLLCMGQGCSSKDERAPASQELTADLDREGVRGPPPGHAASPPEHAPTPPGHSEPPRTLAPAEGRDGPADEAASPSAESGDAPGDADDDAHKGYSGGYGRGDAERPTEGPASDEMDEAAKDRGEPTDAGEEPVR